jgi:gliding motility-associated-like protein
MKASFFLFSFFIFFASNVDAQLCTGSLGDPLVNITFGRGANPGPSLAAAATGYVYVGNDCPSDGFYTVRGNTTNCFSSSWHSLTTDHTGDGNGYFMLVNASIQPSAFYVDTVRGLCGGSTYEFASWIMNVIRTSACNNNGIQPNLTFTISRTDGTVLQSYNSGNITSTANPQWNQYGFFFTTPPGVNDIILRMVNNAPGGCGNDLALDDITFRPCGPQLTPSVTGFNTNTLSLCEGVASNYLLSCTLSSGFINPDFQWQRRINNGSWIDINGANNVIYPLNILPGTAVGLYEYRLAVAEAGNIASVQCRIISSSIILNISANPVATATNNGPVCEGNPIVLTATGGTQYQWTGPNGFTANTSSPTLTSNNSNPSGTYNVTVTNAAGCIDNASTTIIVRPSPLVGVAFTDTAVCNNSSVTLQASGASLFTWSPAAGLSNTNTANPEASPNTATSYKVVGTNAAGCSDSAFVKVNVYSKAIANAGPDRTIILGNNTTLGASIQGEFERFEWLPSSDITDPFVLQPIVAPQTDATYTLSVTSKNGCGTSTDDVSIKLYTGLFIPNAFSPNNDGLNDTWNIPALNAYPNFELKVFNRLGQPVFENSQSNKPWDGTFKGQSAEQGVYVYFIKLNNELPIQKGTVMIVK